MAGFDDGALERLAELEHEQWMTWARTILETEPDLSAGRRERWGPMLVPYADLPEDVKEFDREWARKALEVVKGRRAPVNSGEVPGFRNAMIPWETFERAYLVYSQAHSSQPIERVAERGGFGPVELDRLIGKDWRKEVTPR